MIPVTFEGGGSLRGHHLRGARIVAVGVASALLTVAGCSTNREVTKPKPVPVTAKRLSATLLTAADLPPGWSVVTGSGSPLETDVVPGHGCDDPLTKLTPKAQVSADFTKDGLALTDTAAWFPGQGPAVVQVYLNLLAACRQVVLSTEGLSIRAAPLNFGVLSNDVLPIRVEIEPATGVIKELDLIVMRRGDLLHVIRLNGPRPSDKSLLDSIVRTDMGRLGLLYDDTT